MRLIRFGEKGKERPGLLRGDGIVDLTRIFRDIPDITAAFFEQGWFERIKTADAPAEKREVRLGPPLAGPSKIICLGKNYADHAREGGFEAPEKPILFSKAPSALNGPNDPIVLPLGSRQVDWEVELAVVIGKRCKRVDAADAFSCVAGVTVMNDVSGRDAQFGDGQWFRGKSFDGFAPLGPAVVTLDEVDDIDNLELNAFVDGVCMQTGNTRNLIFKIPFMIEYICRDMTLMPGDVISTGTPSGVGIFREPPVLLQPGSVVECRIEGIGTLVNPVIGQ